MQPLPLKLGETLDGLRSRRSAQTRNLKVYGIKTACTADVENHRRRLQETRASWGSCNGASIKRLYGTWPDLTSKQHDLLIHINSSHSRTGQTHLRHPVLAYSISKRTEIELVSATAQHQLHSPVHSDNINRSTRPLMRGTHTWVAEPTATHPYPSHTSSSGLKALVRSEPLGCFRRGTTPIYFRFWRGRDPCARRLPAPVHISDSFIAGRPVADTKVLATATCIWIRIFLVLMKEGANGFHADSCRTSLARKSFACVTSDGTVQ